MRPSQMRILCEVIVEGKSRSRFLFYFVKKKVCVYARIQYYTQYRLE